jgi:hypothetical protein
MNHILVTPDMANSPCPVCGASGSHICSASAPQEGDSAAAPAARLDFTSALAVATQVFEQYRVEQSKWWKRMDGTPILNDIAVRMARAFVEAQNEN